MRPLDPAIKKVWTIKFAVTWLLLFLAAGFYELLRLFGSDENFLPPGVIVTAVLLTGSLLTYFVPRLRYRYWRFELLPDELYLERGILNRVRTIVPLRRIQHLDVSQNILEREFGLGKLIVHTAGARSSDVILPGLQHDEAESLRDKVKRYILEDEAMA
jgi:uncharacterized protein